MIRSVNGARPDAVKNESMSALTRGWSSPKNLHWIAV
jgi:hypothetical protein